ncbi:MAG: DUF4381 domain-containing protein [Gammaproteobacteria bacterium]|nr:DUF4381 domain-containing protein [Gammaproteobacteria bacterium]
MSAENPLLAQLKDIHAAGDPGWWPPAPGWWVLALLILLLLAWLGMLALRRLSVVRRRKAWLRTLDELKHQHDPAQQPQEYLAALNRLFRAVSLRAFPGTDCVRLEGRAWVDFLASLVPDNVDRGCLGALAEGPYRAAPAFDADRLEAAARSWVRRYG